MSEPQGLWEIFDAVARHVPDREGVVWRDRRLTYQGLRDRSVRLANVLADAGLGLHTERGKLRPWERGQDTVGMYLLNGPEYLETTMAGFASRTATFNINYRYVARELRQLLLDAGAAAIVYHARFASSLAEVLPDLPRRPLLLQVADDSGKALLDGALDYEDSLAAAPSDLSVAGQSPEDLYLLYTGGTTGQPKGVLWRQQDIWLAVLGGDGLDTDDLEAFGADLVEVEGMRYMSAAPFMHGGGHWFALRALLSGGTVIIPDVNDRLDPADVWSVVEREEVFGLLLVGEAFARPLSEELERGHYDASALALMAVGGTMTTPEVKRRLLTQIPHLMIADVAGSSESGSALSQMSSGGSDAEPGVFELMTDAAVLSEDRSNVVEPGEDIEGWWARTGPIPLGYLGDEAKTRDTFVSVDGKRYVVPGDRVRQRSDGAVVLLGRDSTTINTGGEKVFAEEVEQALLDHHAVRDVVVVGRPSERWGSEVVAVVQLVDEVSVADDEIIDSAATDLARYKLPKALVRVDQVRRSPAGKPDYAWARQLVAQAVAT